MTFKVLHVLSQRPSLTGSGITLDAMVRLGRQKKKLLQKVVVGVPAGDKPSVGGLAPEDIHPLFFNTDGLPFKIPGMSDVMPYDSSRFSSLSSGQIKLYSERWEAHLKKILMEFKPDIIHSHHIWILSALLKKWAPSIPLVTHCHATGFRQMELCPQLKQWVVSGVRKNDSFCVLHHQHKEQLASTLNIDAKKIHVVGAGFREELFAPGTGDKNDNQLLYIGKYANAKGLPFLLDSFIQLQKRLPNATLHVAGSGGGTEADGLKDRMENTPGVILHGHLSQGALAKLMQQSQVTVLPSFYEGLPLVLVEALACGCRLVCTELTGVMTAIAPHLKFAIELVPLPKLVSVDQPHPEQIPKFVNQLAFAMEAALSKPLIDFRSPAYQTALAHFTWQTVFDTIHEIWSDLVNHEN